MVDVAALAAHVEDMAELAGEAAREAAGRLTAALTVWAALAARVWVRAYGGLDAPAGPGLDSILAALATGGGRAG